MSLEGALQVRINLAIEEVHPSGVTSLITFQDLHYIGVSKRKESASPHEMN
jgi:hypothetical protein